MDLALFSRRAAEAARPRQFCLPWATMSDEISEVRSQSVLPTFGHLATRLPTEKPLAPPLVDYYALLVSKSQQQKPRRPHQPYVVPATVSLGEQPVEKPEAPSVALMNQREQREQAQLDAPGVETPGELLCNPPLFPSNGAFFTDSPPSNGGVHSTGFVCAMEEEDLSPEEQVRRDVRQRFDAYLSEVREINDSSVDPTELVAWFQLDEGEPNRWQLRHRIGALPAYDAQPKKISQPRSPAYSFRRMLFEGDGGGRFQTSSSVACSSQVVGDEIPFWERDRSEAALARGRHTMSATQIYEDDALQEAEACLMDHMQFAASIHEEQTLQLEEE